MLGTRCGVWYLRRRADDPTRIKYENAAITKRSRPCGAIKNSANELGTSNRQNCARLIFSYIVYFRSQKSDILIFFFSTLGSRPLFWSTIRETQFFLHKYWIYFFIFFIYRGETLWIHLTIIYISFMNVILRSCFGRGQRTLEIGLPIV